MQDFFLFIHFIGLAMGVGASFAMARLGMATKDLPVAERAEFFRRAIAVGKNGSIGLGLLLLSGLCMLFTRGVGTVFASGGPAFHVKLALVVVLCGLVGASQVQIKRFRVKQDLAALKKAQKLGPAVLFTGLGIVLCAVLAFH